MAKHRNGHRFPSSDDLRRMENGSQKPMFPRENGVRARVGDTCKNPFPYWSMIFNLPKIGTILKRNDFTSI